MNGYNFTERVRRVLMLARGQALHLGHEYVGTEHILLGICAEGKGTAAAVLHSLQVDLEGVVTSVHQVVRPGTTPTDRVDLPYTSRAKKVLELAMSEARELSHTYVGTEHLLLGLIREEKGIAAQVLQQHGATAAVVRPEVIRLLAADPAEAGTAPDTERLTRKRTPSVHVTIVIEHADGRVEARKFKDAYAAVVFLAGVDGAQDTP
jgi:ATP-dependent Clp protease ATP-binding subunit ClpC